MDLSQFTDDQLSQALTALVEKKNDKSLPISEREEARDQALTIANIVKSKQEPLKGIDATKQAASDFSQRANIGVLNTLGFPTDLAVGIVNRGLGMIPIENNPYPLPYEDISYLPTSYNLKKSVKAIGDMIGVDYLGDYQRPAESYAGQLGQAFGEVGSFFFPMVKTAQTIDRLRKLAPPNTVVQSLAKNITEEAAEKPIRMTTAEAAAAAGIGSAREISQEMDLGPGTSMTLELLAGIGSPLSIYGLSNLPTAQVMRYGAKKVGELKAEPSVTAKEGNRAAKVLQELVENPEAVIRRLEASADNPNLTVAQRTEEPLLTALEAKLISKSEGPKGTIKKNRDGEIIINKLKEAILKKGTTIKDTVKFAKARKEAFELSVQARLNEAGTELNETLLKIKNANIDKSPDEIARIGSLAIRETIEKALDDVVSQEKLLWGSIPKSVKGPQDTLVKTVQRILRTTSRAQIEDIPEAVNYINTSMYKRNGKLKTVQESVKELIGLYTKLGETQRKALVAGDVNKARIAGVLQDAIVKDMSKWKGKGAGIQRKIDEARSFSLLKNKYFKQGSVGEMLGYAKKGELKVPASLTAETVLRGTAQNRLEKALNITEAEKFSKTMLGDNVLNSELKTLGGLDDYIRAEFLINAFDDGVLNQAKARNFMKVNRMLLDLVPNTKNLLMNARTQADVAKRIEKASDAFQSSMRSKADSSLARLLNSDPDNVIKKILSADRADKFEQMKTLVNLAKKDKSGLAIEGLKNAISRYLVDEAMSVNEVSKLTGRPTINANKLLNRLMDDELLDATMRQVFDAKEIADIRYAVKQMKLIQDSQKALVDVEAVTVVPGSLMEKLFRIIGIKTGAAVGGGQVGSPLVLAGEGRKVAEQIFKRFNPDKARELLLRAFKDAELMKVLLQKGKPTKNGFNLKFTAPQVKVLKSYLVAPLVTDRNEEVYQEKVEAANQSAIEELLAQ